MWRIPYGGWVPPGHPGAGVAPASLEILMIDSAQGDPGTEGDRL